MRRAASDANEKLIVDALRKMGCSVERIRSLRGGCPDLLIGLDGKNYLVEVKQPKTGRLSAAQIKWHSEWNGGAPLVVRAVDDVILFVNLLRKRK